MPSQDILKNCDVERILFFKIRPSQETLKIRDGTPLEAEEILTYIKKPSKRIEILKIHDGTPLEKKRVAQILFFKIRLSQEILKIRDGTPLEEEEIMTYIKNPRNGLVWHFCSKLYVPSNVVQNKRVARILGGRNFDINKKALEIGPRNTSVGHFSSKLDVPSNIVQKKRVTQIMFFKIRPSQDILKNHDGTPLEAEEILTYIKNPRNGSVWHFCSKLYVPSNVVQKKRVARILFFKIRSSQEILKIHDGTPLEAEEILTYIKGPRNRPSKYIVWTLF
ncbi:hypothetical protein OROHE_015367 [Orobanche hederae]